MDERGGAAFGDSLEGTGAIVLEGVTSALRRGDGHGRKHCGSRPPWQVCRDELEVRLSYGSRGPCGNAAGSAGGLSHWPRRRSSKRWMVLPFNSVAALVIASSLESGARGGILECRGGGVAGSRRGWGTWRSATTSNSTRPLAQSSGSVNGC